MFKQFLLIVLSLFISSNSLVLAETTGKTTVVVGTEGTMNPFTYFDENNHLTGFDVEVVRAIEKVDPSLSFSFVTSTWDSLFPGIDAGHYQILADQIAFNKNRDERYYLSREYYLRGSTQPITLKEHGDKLKTFEDLKGKKVAVGAGTNHALALENWNEKNGNAITIVYYDGEVGLMFQDLLNYRVDAIMNSPASIGYQAKANNVEISFVGEPIYDATIHFVFPRTEQGKQLRDQVDAALKKLREQGTLKALSLQFFNNDLT